MESGCLNRISSEIERKIVELWFAGHSRDNTATITGVAGSTVSAVVNSFPACLRPLRDLSVALAKLNCLPADALKGINLLVQLAEQGVTPEQIPFFIEAFKKMSTDADYQPERMIQAGIKVAELEAQSGKKYIDAVKDFNVAIKREREVTRESNRIEEENSRKLRETKRIEHKRRQMIKKCKLTPQQIFEYEIVKAGLRKHGIELNDADNLRKYLDNMKTTGCDPRCFVSFTQKYGFLQRSYEHIESQRAIAKAELRELHTHIAEKQTEKSQLYPQVNYLRSQANSLAPRVDFYNDQVRKSQTVLAELQHQIAAVINQIGKILGMTDSEMETLRLSNQIHLIEAVIENKMRYLTKNLAAEAVIHCIMA